MPHLDCPFWRGRVKIQRILLTYIVTVQAIYNQIIRLRIRRLVTQRPSIKKISFWPETTMISGTALCFYPIRLEPSLLWITKLLQQGKHGTPSLSSFNVAMRYMQTAKGTSGQRTWTAPTTRGRDGPMARSRCGLQSNTRFVQTTQQSILLHVLLCK